MIQKKTAVLLTNLGTPETNTVSGVKKFLKQFLSDRRVVEIPPVIWWFILNLIILPFRSRSALHAYNMIWTPQGSPLMSISRSQQQALQQLLGSDIRVELMMRYGQPAFRTVIQGLIADGYHRLIVLPLYPQNSATTTATSFDHIADALAKQRAVPEIAFINDYHAHPAYIAALANSVREHWRQQPQRFLLMSFHGLPRRNVELGDPYHEQCLASARLLAQALQLDDSQWAISFQSRFGKQEWIKPYTSEMLQKLAGDGLRDIDVICPGFSVDCLETLEEIKLQNRDIFLEHGGENYNYIPCLNDRADHIDMMKQIVMPYLG